MTLQLKTKAWLSDLHCSVGLTDWDMDKELKLATTSDQFYHDEKLSDQYVVQRPSARSSRRKDEFTWYDKTSDTFVKPNPWLWVNPNIVCPVRYGADSEDMQTVCEPAEKIQTSGPDPAETRHQLPSENHVFTSHDAPLQEELLQSMTSTEYMINTEVVSCQPTKNRRKGRTTKARAAADHPPDTFPLTAASVVKNDDRESAGLDPSGHKEASVSDSKTLKPGCWPRPPVNYCILIALALKSSHTGSLKVQQIYSFCREHFPFFQTAPDGWKNTIRHNLCFNNSFRKTCNQLCRDGKRKSCFWHLTLDGHRRLREEIRMLTGDTLKQLEMSMSHPDLIQSLFTS